jgi:hypothetical protein
MSRRGPELGGTPAPARGPGAWLFRAVLVAAVMASSPAGAEPAVVEMRVAPGDGPAAIQAAIDRARDLRRSGGPRPIEVRLAQGIHRPAAPLRIEGDFGPGGLRLMAAPGEKVEIVGAELVDPQPPVPLAPSEAARIAPQVLARLRVVPTGPPGATDPAALPNAGLMLFQGDRALTPAPGRRRTSSGPRDSGPATTITSGTNSRSSTTRPCR